ncbi:hypothetical protein MJD09_08735 [bacterium]|nr:hypothetical protein [bacterium]
MNSLSNRLKGVIDAVIQNLSFRNAIGVSIFLHVFIAIAVTSVFVNNRLMAPQSDTRIELEISTEDENIPETARDVGTLNILDNTNASTTSLPSLSQAEEAASGAEPKTTNDRDAIIFASLESLSELRESFNFLEATLTASVGSSLPPAEGEAPDVSGLGTGLRGGFGYGSGGRGVVIGVIGGGGGDCPPRGN